MRRRRLPFLRPVLLLGLGLAVSLGSTISFGRAAVDARIEGQYGLGSVETSGLLPFLVRARGATARGPILDNTYLWIPGRVIPIREAENWHGVIW